MRSDSNSSERPANMEYGRIVFVYVVILFVIFVLATCSNMFVLCKLWIKRKRNTRTRLFVLHLCLADLMVAFFQVLPQIMERGFMLNRGNVYLCLAIKYFEMVGMFASTYTLLAMTMDRYQAVCQPMVFFTEGPCRRYLSIGTAWLISLAFSAPQIYFYSPKDGGDKRNYCWPTDIPQWASAIYILWITLSVFVLPAGILLYCQIRISRTIYLSWKRKAMKTVTMTFVIIVTYIVCWSPYFVVHLWSEWSPSTAPKGPLFHIIGMVVGLNSCTNPWIYLCYS